MDRFLPRVAATYEKHTVATHKSVQLQLPVAGSSLLTKMPSNSTNMREPEKRTQRGLRITFV